MEISSAFRWTYKCGMVWDLISRIVIIWDFCSTDINNTLYYPMTGDEIYFQNTGSCCFWNWRNIFRFQLHTYVGTEKFFLKHRIQMSLYIQIQRRGTCSFRHQINIQVLLCLTKNISEHTIVILAHLTRRVMNVIVIILHLFVCRRYVVHRLQSSPLV